jgi:hypothetical protein
MLEMSIKLHFKTMFIIPSGDKTTNSTKFYIRKIYYTHNPLVLILHEPYVDQLTHLRDNGERLNTNINTQRGRYDLL